MSRIPALDYQDMTEAQKAVFDKICIPETRKLKGASSILIYLPELASCVYDAMEIMRNTSTLRLMDYHLIPCIISRRFSVAHMWGNHAAFAMQNGLPKEIIDDINHGKTPTFADSVTEMIYTITNLLCDRRALQQEAFDEAKDLLGEDKLTETATIFGIYTMVATLFQAFDFNNYFGDNLLDKNYTVPGYKYKDSKRALINDRMTPISLSELTNAQRKLYDKIAGSRDGNVNGPQIPRLRLPEISNALQSINDILRLHTSFPISIFELVVILVARKYNADYMWGVHAKKAKDSGLDQMIIDAINNREYPVFAAKNEKMIFEYCQELLSLHIPSQELYEQISSELGLDKLIELTMLVGYYGVGASTINVYNISSKPGNPQLV